MCCKWYHSPVSLAVTVSLVAVSKALTSSTMLVHDAPSNCCLELLIDHQTSSGVKFLFELQNTTKFTVDKTSFWFLPSWIISLPHGQSFHGLAMFNGDFKAVKKVVRWVHQSKWMQVFFIEFDWKYLCNFRMLFLKMPNHLFTPSVTLNLIMASWHHFFCCSALFARWSFFFHLFCLCCHSRKQELDLL